LKSIECSTTEPGNDSARKQQIGRYEETFAYRLEQDLQLHLTDSSKGKYII
jgi:hypothetical protein